MNQVNCPVCGNKCIKAGKTKDKSRVTTLALQEMQFISYTQNRQLCQRTANLLGLVVWKGIPVINARRWKNIQTQNR